MLFRRAGEAAAGSILVNFCVEISKILSSYTNVFLDAAVTSFTSSSSKHTK